MLSEARARSARDKGIRKNTTKSQLYHKELVKKTPSMGSSWKTGVWLGHARNSNEILIGTGEGVVRAYAVIRRAEGERWDADALRKVRGTPQQPDPNKPGMHIPTRL